MDRGGALKSCETSTAYWVAYSIEILAFTSVDLFGILSGYLGIHKKRPGSYRVTELVIIVLFYCVLITAFMRVLFPDSCQGVMGIVTGLFPPIEGRYWYITCYIPIAILQPYINRGVSSLSKEAHRKLVLIMILVFAILPSATRIDLFVFNHGYSFVWLLCLYIIGAYIKRTDLFKDRKRIRIESLLLLIASLVFVLLVNIVVFTITNGKIGYLVEYISPIVLLMAICILFLFRDIKCEKLAKQLMVLSASSFDVYIIHSHILIFNYLLLDAFVWIGKLGTLLIPLSILFCGMAIYIACSIISVIRIFLFKLIKFNYVIRIISKMIDNIVYPTSLEDGTAT
jgi:surface polysaccharide O-acyltransferase-like enzyme